MPSRSFPGFASVLLISASMALGLAACGSDDGNGGDAVKQGGEVIPGKKAPESAKDRNGNAPDRGISNRPGGPKPVSP